MMVEVSGVFSYGPRSVLHAVVRLAIGVTHSDTREQLAIQSHRHIRDFAQRDSSVR